MVWCGVVWCGVVWCGVVWCGVAWRGVAWRGVAWRGVVWCGVVWCGVAWRGVVWCGVVWCGVVWCGVAWCGVVWRGVVWCGVVWCGVVWCGVVWCGVVWCGVVWDPPPVVLSCEKELCLAPPPATPDTAKGASARTCSCIPVDVQSKLASVIISRSACTTRLRTWALCMRHANTGSVMLGGPRSVPRALDKTTGAWAGGTPPLCRRPPQATKGLRVQRRSTTTTTTTTTTRGRGVGGRVGLRVPPRDVLEGGGGGFGCPRPPPLLRGSPYGPR